MGTRKVRLTMWPDEEVEVDDASYIDLERDGLIVKESSDSVTKSAKAPTASKEVN
jgi:hypothetical protein